MLKHLCLFFHLAFFAASLHVSVPPGTKECFYHSVQPYHKGLYATFQVLNEHTEAIQFTVSDGNQKQLYRESGKESRYFKVLLSEDVARGDYSVCFANVIRPVGPALIGFTFHVKESTEDVLSNADATTISHAQRVSKLVMELNIDLDMVKDNQEYDQARTSMHEDLVKDTHIRVFWWSCFELVVLMCCAYWQVSFLRRAFEVKRII